MPGMVGAADLGRPPESRWRCPWRRRRTPPATGSIRPPHLPVPV